ncbi:hypothetical protein EXE59_18515 [Nocardioides eburneiflavus]|uniref:Metallophosphoesterase n=1 Tax=Nocardioides eburneiflavus TaxID=2518372 RepID=A0A4Z1CD48_9ACTN|nr:hypothetical protein [Nocardioides eburneiflavus]TGN65726.1 hypothetical protein EXE59_18515 [Nocardioides eburneiflavus]
MTPRTSDVGRVLATFAVSAMAAGVVCSPLVAERAVESVSFADHLGVVPVEVSVTHNGTSTLDTGVFGRLYWDRTGAGGFGALLRITGPPQADGDSLAAYASPGFLKTSTAFIDDPSAVARAYGEELRSRALITFWRLELVVALVGGVLLTLVLRGRPPFPGASWRRRAGICLVVGAAATASSVVTAVWLFHQWDGNAPVEDALPLPGVPGVSLSSSQSLEIAAQVRPFVEKNTRRIRERSDAYAAAVSTSLAAELADPVLTLDPRPGEQIVLAEADTQGSFVGQRVREAIYAVLRERLGDDAIAVRTISGDVTSNGTVAEASYVHAEAGTLPGTPLIVVKGDHDTATTLAQLDDEGIVNPHLDPVEVDGLRVVAGNDPTFKTLFGGTVVNDSGTTQAEIGAAVRMVVDPDLDGEVPAMVVLLHQPGSVDGYLGVDALDLVDDVDTTTSTTPREDGVPDVPPGIVNIGHLHDSSSPVVLWNTDTDDVTWTVVNQLGTAGGVEENPTFNRFSTPFSTPLKDLSVQLQYVDVATGLQTGYVELTAGPSGTVTVSGRTDLGLPLVGR